jgi:hypothetical protein
VRNSEKATAISVAASAAASANAGVCEAALTVVAWLLAEVVSLKS